MGDASLEKRLLAAGLGRFQVMALLQAARHYLFYRDIGRAKSFGLNRAIFYAWAKHYGPHTPGWRREKLEKLERQAGSSSSGSPGSGPPTGYGRECGGGLVEVLGECVGVSVHGYYVIGGREQTPRDFDENVVARVRRVLDFEQAWRAAVEYVSQFPEWVLRDQQKFYKLVYEPVRDTFFKDLLAGRKPSPPKRVLEKLKALEEVYRRALEEKQKQKSLLEYTGDSGSREGSGRG